MRRIYEIPIIVRYKALKRLENKKKYSLYIKKNEKKIIFSKDKNTSCILCSIMIYKDSTLGELQQTLSSIRKQVGYVSNKVILILEKEKYEQTDLKLYIDDLLAKGKILLYTGIHEPALRSDQYMVVIKCGDILSPYYLYEMENCIEQSKADLIYADEDEIIVSNMQRQNPYFKPDWSPDTLLSYNYIGNSSCIRIALLRKYGIELNYENDLIQYQHSKKYFILWNYDYLLRTTEVSKQIYHTNKIMYHRAYSEDETMYDRILLNEEKNTKVESLFVQTLIQVKYNALARRGVECQIIYDKDSKLGNILYDSKYEKISIIIPTKNNNTIFEQCVNSILKVTKNSKYEIIVIDNGSDSDSRRRYQQYCEKYKMNYIWKQMEFNFSRMCNLGTSYAQGDILLFLNDDTQIIQENWLDILAGQALMDKTALVGVKLLYPDKETIQHCGIINQSGNYTHAFYQMKQSQKCYHNLSNTVMNCFSVTGACLCITKKIFDQLGGWSEEFPIAYNDVELGIRALREGFVNVVRNDVVVLHYESLSRGTDMKYKQLYRLGKERRKLIRMYEDFGNNDPYYNKNLSRYTTDYDINY